MLFKDIRDYQILYLALFLILGIGTRDWTLKPSMIVVTITTSLATQLLLTLIVNRLSFADDKEHKTNIRSPLITSLGISLLLRADYSTTMVFAAAMAIASKFVFKFGDKHFFNPANFGIISALVLTPDAWVSPGQWGEDWWYGMLFVGTGGMILHRVGRWDTTAAFLGFYALLEAVRNLWLNWTWDVYWHRLMSGSLLLFALFMVTDPRSIPNSRIGRVIWAACIALVTFVLRNNFYVSTAVFWALFALAPLTVIFDRVWKASRFKWGESVNQLTVNS
ncbi:MAG: RnfABCDGE type electron transport complex subunit D [Nostocales cyanobacterium 94392]|nr:RnfABCDGE type electron transport complex subunit D [Nostocales cyanobacterium 94392]